MDGIGIAVVSGVAAIVVVTAVRRLVHRVVVREFEAGLLYQDGRFVRRLAPGAHWLLAFRNELAVVDARQRVVTVPGQEVLSADSVGLKVSLAVTYEVADPVAALHRTQSFEEALHVSVQLALRAEVGAATIENLLQQRIEIGRRLAERVAPGLAEIGLAVHAIEVKDVMFPGELKKIFAEVVRAQKEGQAALERARGETAALRSLANAARLLQDTPALMNLRVLQSVAGAAAHGGTIVWGVPNGVVPVGGRSPSKGAGEED